MSNNILSAMNAYQQALTRISAKTGQEPEVQKTTNTEFKDMVTSAVNSAVDISKNAEQISMQAIAGKADIQDVVLAVSNAEMALETVVAVRDTAIKAYKEIMSMPM